MISRDQPTIFGDRVVVAVSSMEDGAMNFKGYDPAVIQDNRTSFLEAAGVDPLMTTLVRVTYDDTTDFTRYKVVDEEQAVEGMLEPSSLTVADALIATRPGHALFLPLADCVGAVLFDPENEILMVSHLGRHSILQQGGAKSIEYLAREFDSDPSRLSIWLSPAIAKAEYPLHDLGGKGLHEAILEQMIAAGANPSLIEVSHVNTAEDPDYYSHSEFLKGEQPDDGRFAIVAMMVE